MNKLRSSTPRHGTNGFTLMEILVALMIFGATMAAIATVIHTSVRAWRTGHEMSELTQAAHAAQDVIERDLVNLYYMPEMSYNKSFRKQLMTLASQMDQQNGNGGDRRPRRNSSRFRSRHAEERAAGVQASGDPNGDFGLADVTPPIDLSFHGASGGAISPASTTRASTAPTDDATQPGSANSASGDLSFARLQPARWEGDPETGGIRRVHYYVKDNALYREENDPYGFRPGAAYDIDNDNDRLQSLQTLSQLYMTDPESRAAAPADMAAEAAQAIPTHVNYAEPLCPGIRRFQLAFGYFRDGNWQETNNWDSGQVQYRHYLDPEELEDRNSPISQLTQNTGYSPNSANSYGQNQAGMSGDINQLQKKARARQPDELPGYIKITLTIVPPESKGKEHEYSFMYSIPQAQEDDIYDPVRAADAGGDVHTADKLGTEVAASSANSAPADNGSGSRYNRSAGRYNHGRNSGNSSGNAFGGQGGQNFNFGQGGNGAAQDPYAPGWGWNTETGY